MPSVPSKDLQAVLAQLWCLMMLTLLNNTAYNNSHTPNMLVPVPDLLATCVMLMQVLFTRVRCWGC